MQPICLNPLINLSFNQEVLSNLDRLMRKFQRFTTFDQEVEFTTFDEEV